MKLLELRTGLLVAATSLMVAACSGNGTPRSTTGNAGSGAGSPGAAGDAQGAAGAAQGAAGSSGAAGATGAGAGNATGSTGLAGAAGGSSGSAGAAATGAAGSSGAAGAAANPDGGAGYPPDTRAINVTGGGVFQMNGLYLNKNKPAQGKLVLLLGGICTGTGAGGFEAFVHEYGFHVYAPATDTCLDGGKVPQMYKDTLKTSPNDPEANRQIGDSRMELWDGKDRVSWYSVAAGKSIQEETIAAIKSAMAIDDGGDWGFFLNADGTLHTQDVWVVGYSWGSQTWAMISAYVPFGRVITTSGPQDEGFPNATWITNPPATGTPGDRKYMLVGFNSAYPSTNGNDSEVMSMCSTVSRAGWPGVVTNVQTTSPGPYMASQHLFAMIGGDGGTTPPGHTVFCNDNPADGWLPVCKYILNQQ